MFRFVSLFALIGALFSLSGCGDNDGTTTTMTPSVGTRFGTTYCSGGTSWFPIKSLELGPGGAVFWLPLTENREVNLAICNGYNQESHAVFGTATETRQMDVAPLMTVDADGTVYVHVAFYTVRDQQSVWDELHALHSNGTRKWSYNITETEDYHQNRVDFGFKPATVAGGTAIYVTGLDKVLYAFNKDDGLLKWNLSLPEYQLAAPTVAPDGIVFVAGSGLNGADCKLFALDGETGSMKWSRIFRCAGIANRVGTSTNRVGTPTLGARGVVVLGSDNGTLAFDGQDGSIKWHQPQACHSDIPYVHSDIRFPLFTPAVGFDGTVFVPWRYDQVDAVGGNYRLGGFAALSGEDGSPKWIVESHSQTSQFGSAALSTDGTIYSVRRDMDSYSVAETCLYALDAETGAVKWRSGDNGYSNLIDAFTPPMVGREGMVIVVLDVQVGQWRSAGEMSLLKYDGEGGPVEVPYEFTHSGIAAASLI